MSHNQDLITIALTVSGTLKYVMMNLLRLVGISDCNLMVVAQGNRYGLTNSQRMVTIEKLL